MKVLLQKKSQSIAYILNGSEHIYWNLDPKNEVHSIWVIWTSGLQECKGHVMVGGLGQGRGAKALAFLVLPVPAILTHATVVEGI